MKKVFLLLILAACAHKKEPELIVWGSNNVTPILKFIDSTPEFFAIHISDTSGVLAYKKKDSAWVIYDAAKALEVMYNSQKLSDSLRDNYYYLLLLCAEGLKKENTYLQTSN